MSPLYLHRINFALALAAGKVQGVVVALEDVIRSEKGNPEATASIIGFFNEHIFGGGLSARTLAALDVPASGGVGLLSRVVGLALASPEMQAR